MLTIADAKRGDIGSTMAAYADAWLRDGSSLAADSVTLSPYLGFESLRPALDLAAETRPRRVRPGPDLQPGGRLRPARGRTRFRGAPDLRGGRGGEPAGTRDRWAPWAWWSAPPWARPCRTCDLDLAAVRGPILAPGLGAQGATAADLRRTFGAAYPQVLGTSSRDILKAGPGVRELHATRRTRTLDGLRAE